jgi:hypothetical protein
VIKFVSDLRQVGGFLLVRRFPPLQHFRHNNTEFQELEVSIEDLTDANAVLLATRREKQEARQQIDSQ